MSDETQVEEQYQEAAVSEQSIGELQGRSTRRTENGLTITVLR